MTTKRTLSDGFYWVDHPIQGTIIIKVENNLIFQMATLASRQADDKQFNEMARAKAEPFNFNYTNEHGWF